MKKPTIGIFSIVLCLFTFYGFAATQAVGDGPAPFKTGVYRICSGSEEECRSGKGFPGGDYLHFEKNNAGWHDFKYEEDHYTWSREGNTLTITPVYEDAPYTLEIGADSKVLVESKDRTVYLLDEDEDTVFRPGVYFQCPKNTVESCNASLGEFLDFYTEENHTPFAYLTFFSEGGTGRFCPKGSDRCPDLKWTRNPQEGPHIQAVIHPGKSARVFTIQKNTLVDDTGALYMRALSERVAQSMN